MSETMANPKITLLSHDEKKRIHENSLDVLQKVGIQFNSKKAIDILADAGCEVDSEKLSARFPPHLVEQALETLPSSFLLAARDPDKDVIAGDGGLYFTAPGQCPYAIDLETGERRLATLDDLIQSAHLCEAIGEIHQWVPCFLPGDVAPRMRQLRALQVTLLYTSKNFLGGSERLEFVPFFFECIDAVLGHRSKLLERPIYSPVINPSSPLTNGGTLVDVMLEFAPYKLPIFLQFLPLAGATAPITLAGTVLQENVAFLGNMTFYQIVQPGWPLIWAAAAGAMDMHSGRYVGGPEAILMTLALDEMAEFYGVPVNNFGSSSSESFGIGFQNGLEMAMGMVTQILIGVDNFWWPSDLDGFNIMDLADIVLGREVVRQVERLKRGITLDDEHFLIDVIGAMKFQGEYLGNPSTKKYFREEHLLPELFPRESFEAWEAKGLSEREIAVARAKEILTSHEPVQVEKEVQMELDRIMAAAEKELLD
jgi:trimethylamine--corrinoid protein Co-methyltransferase